MLKVPASVARLSFGFSAISLRSQKGVRFRYKLDNFDSSWNMSASDHIATYTNLPAGHYRFRVVVFDISEPLEVSEFDIAFEKAPFFYETWWFYTLCALFLAGGAWTAYQLRLRQMRTMFSAVLEERNRLAREMHDTVIQGCTGTSALLEAIASTSDNSETKKWELLEYARIQIRTTINEAREAVWHMRHERENEIDSIEALRGVATQMMREHGRAVTFEHNLERLPLGASAVHEILMAVREAIYNSVQHSGTGEIELKMHASEHDFTISIIDNGCGFRSNNGNATEDGHYGIVGMRERMQRLGGRFELTSTIGTGTTVKLRVYRKKGVKHKPELKGGSA